MKDRWLDAPLHLPLAALAGLLWLCLYSATQYGQAGEAMYRQKRLTASYMHLYFPSNPQAVARLFLES